MTPSIYVVEYQNDAAPDEWRLYSDELTCSKEHADEIAQEFRDTPGVLAVRVVRFERDVVATW